MNEIAVARKKPTVKFLTLWQLLIEAAAANPARLFWTFVGAHMVLWTIVPALVCPNAPLDVIENYAWGHEWLMGTHKHPPMQAWWLEIFAAITGRASWAHYLASQLAVSIAFWAVWQTGCRMLGERLALIGVLLLEGVIYYNFTSPEFNANILQLPFWGLIGWSFHRAVKDNRTADWLMLGLWSAGGLYSKYSTVLLLTTLALLLVLHPDGRKCLKSSGPWLALGFAFVLFAPHLAWLMQHHFVPFNYARNQMHPPHHDSFLLLGLVSSQLLALLPAALLYFAVFNRRLPEQDRLHSFDRAFLCFITFGPFVLTFLLALTMGFKIHDMWATPFWSFIGLWAIFRFPPALSHKSIRRFGYGWAVIFVSTLTAYALMTLYGPYLTHQTQRVHFPGQALAQKMDDAWQARFGTPMTYVIGDIWPAGNVAYYTPGRPHVFIMGNRAISPWISMEDLGQKGGIIVWCIRYCAIHDYEEHMPSFVSDEFPNAEIQPSFALPRQTGADVDPVVLGWAILPPAPAASPRPLNSEP